MRRSFFAAVSNLRWDPLHFVSERDEVPCMKKETLESVFSSPVKAIQCLECAIVI